MSTSEIFASPKEVKRRPARTKCRGCGQPIEHQDETGRRRNYCSRRCRYQHRHTRDFDRRFCKFPPHLGGSTGRARKGGSNPLKPLPEKQRKPQSSLFAQTPLDLLGGHRWPGAPTLDRPTLAKVIQTEIGG